MEDAIFVVLRRIGEGGGKVAFPADEEEDEDV